MKSLYVHFPFCESKCHYCDFYSLGAEKTKSEDPLHFEQALFEEATLWNEKLPSPGEHRFDSIFFGGGTPSMTPPSSMEKSLAPLHLRERISETTEWTMEANPSSIEKEKMKSYRAFGVNRISMGVQALRPDLLKDLGRVHSREAVFQALDSVFGAGFENVSVDLLCGVPNQKLEDLEKAMNELMTYPIQHLSCYLLTLPPHHRMFKDLPDEEEQLSHLLFIDQKMKDFGFIHYEISNFARSEKTKARHNLNYWKGESYLGLGPSAHSFQKTDQISKRWKNFSSIHKYGNSLKESILPIEQEETLTPDQMELEKWMLALRLDEGFPESWLKSPSQKAKSQELLKHGLLEKHPEHVATLRPTPRGFALSDQMISTLTDVGP